MDKTLSRNPIVKSNRFPIVFWRKIGFFLLILCLEKSISAQTVYLECNASSVDLSSYFSAPDNGNGITALKYFDGTDPATATEVTSVGAGTYYGFYHDAANSCYSDNYASITVIARVCYACPATSIDLSSYYTATDNGNGITDLAWFSEPSSSGTALSG